MTNVFSVPIFFIVFRETLESAIIIPVLLGLIEQVVKHGSNRLTGGADAASRSSTPAENPQAKAAISRPSLTPATERSSHELLRNESEKGVTVTADNKRLLTKLRLQIIIGFAVGVIIDCAIGAAFIAVWFTQGADFWELTEELWTAILELIAAILIFAISVIMIRVNRSEIPWSVRLQRTFDGQRRDVEALVFRAVLVLLPFITALREAIEAIIFVGGVELGQTARSIPLAAIVGLICGLACGVVIYGIASRTPLKWALILMTNFFMLVGSGLFSKCTTAFQLNWYYTLLGIYVDDAAGDGPGSYVVQGSVWHLDCCNPDNNTEGTGWMIFGAILGWTNSASYGTILSYIFYWLTFIVTLVVLKWREGRAKLSMTRLSSLLRRRAGRGQAASGHSHPSDTPEAT